MSRAKTVLIQEEKEKISNVKTFATYVFFNSTYISKAIYQTQQDRNQQDEGKSTEVRNDGENKMI